MGKFIRFIPLFLVLCYASFAFGAPTKFRKIQKDIRSQASELKKISGEIAGLEEGLRKQGDRHLKTLEIKRTLEEKMESAQVGLQHARSAYSRERAKIDRMLEKTVVSEDVLQKGSEGLLVAKIIKDNLRARARKTDDQKNRVEHLLDRLEKLRRRLSEYESVESDLANLVRTLRETKKRRIGDFEKIRENKAKLEVQVEKLKKIRATAPPRFDLPLRRPFRASRVKKGGASFTFTGAKSVHAGDDGKVVYAGPLSNYGTVIIIKHNRFYRSVFHGQFEPKVKQGDQVKRKQRIGQFRVRNGKLHFEVRRKDRSVDVGRLLRGRIFAKKKRRSAAKI